MNKMINILHLSDLHYDPTKAGDVEIILEALWKDLKKEPRIDCIVFSGDLVKAGDNRDAFKAAHEIFIQPLLEKTGLPPDRFFIAPGNHDIQRDSVDEYLEEGFRQKFKSREEVNAFLDKEMETGFPHIERLDHFNQFKAQFGGDAVKSSNKLFSTFIVEIEPLKVGIACLNTCWRATGRGEGADQGTLLIGGRQIDAAAKDLNQCQLKLAVYHHPLDWLAEIDQLNSERKIARKFDFVFCGHLHKSNMKNVQNFGDKSVLVQGGTLNKGRDFLNSYAVVTVDPVRQDGVVNLRSYFDDREVFDKAVNVVENGRFAFVLKGHKPGDALKEKKTGESPVSDKKKGMELFTQSLEHLELQKYQRAFNEIQKARQLVPDDLKIQLFYCLSYLTGKPFHAISEGDMNEIVVLLEEVISRGDKECISLARLIMGVIWLDFYEEESNGHKQTLFEQNKRHLERYHPTSEENGWLSHILPSKDAKAAFNLN